MRMQLETITPRKAADWLKRNINNRPLSETFVAKLATAISAGQWQVNGDPVRFDASGDLIDGQHRLTAVIKSGVPIKSWVLRGIESSAFDTIDRGHARTNGDVLARRGEKHYNTLAAASALWFRYFSGQAVDGGKRTPRPDQLDALLAGQGEFLRIGSDFACRNRTPLLPVSEVAFLVSAGLYIYLDANSRVIDFWRRVITAESLRPKSPEHLLHSQLTKSITGNTRLTKKARIAICIKAFNAYIAGADLRCLKYTDGEDFPQFVSKSKAKTNG